MTTTQVTGREEAMRYEEISKTMRGFCGGREALRRLGFRPEDIFCATARSARHGGVLSCFVTLRAQGLEFSIEVGPVPNADEDAFMEEYERVAQAINCGAVSPEDADRIWQESEAYRDKVHLLAAMLAKGFVFPRSVS